MSSFSEYTYTGSDLDELVDDQVINNKQQGGGALSEYTYTGSELDELVDDHAIDGLQTGGSIPYENYKTYYEFLLNFVKLAFTGTPLSNSLGDLITHYVAILKTDPNISPLFNDHIFDISRVETGDAHFRITYNGEQQALNNKAGFIKTKELIEDLLGLPHCDINSPNIQKFFDLFTDSNFATTVSKIFGSFLGYVVAFEQNINELMESLPTREKLFGLSGGAAYCVQTCVTSFVALVLSSIIYIQKAVRSRAKDEAKPAYSVGTIGFLILATIMNNAILMLPGIIGGKIKVDDALARYKEHLQDPSGEFLTVVTNIELYLKTMKEAATNTVKTLGKTVSPPSSDLNQVIHSLGGIMATISTAEFTKFQEIYTSKSLIGSIDPTTLSRPLEFLSIPIIIADTLTNDRSFFNAIATGNLMVNNPKDIM